jgi:hypothetical protein
MGGEPSSILERLARLEASQRKDYYPGELKLWPFPPDELPEHWYLPNGDLTSVDSVPGKALMSLSPAYRSHWGITIQNGMVSLPDVFDDSGDGYFFRPVNGTARAVGSRQGDAMREIEGVSANLVIRMKNESYSGPFFGELITADRGLSGNINSATNHERPGFRASQCVPVAPENRSKNVGFTPGIFLPPL